MSKIEISNEELRSLTTAIKKRYDIDFTNYEPKSLKRGFARLIMKHKFGNILGLWQKILMDRAYFIACIDDLTVNLTELFRNPETWVKLHDDILPQFNSKSKINIWHSGCSSGEEVYTMAIVLKDRGLLKKTKALATDVSSSIIAKAIEAKYSNILLNKYAKSFQKYLPNGKIEDCFNQHDTFWSMKDELKKHVEFRHHNLAQDSMDRKFEIIFCRNVMIYFDETLKMKVLQLFHDSLEDDGYLIFGYYDMLPGGAKQLFEVYDSKTRIYRKK